MVVNKLNLPCFPIAPDEADTPSVIDANTVLTATVRPQSFEAIAGRRMQIAEPTSRVIASVFPVIGRLSSSASCIARDNRDNRFIHITELYGRVRILFFSLAVTIFLAMAHMATIILVE